MKTFKQFFTESEDTAFPAGVYMAVKVNEETETALNDYCSKYLAGIEIPEDFHSTLIYSDKPHYDEITAKEYNISAVAEKMPFEKFGEEKNSLVIKLNSPELKRRHEELMKEYNFKYDFDEYVPHISLSYNAKSVDINTLPEINFPIVLTGEYVEALSKPDEDDEYNGSDTEYANAMRNSKKEKDEPSKSDNKNNKK